MKKTIFFIAIFLIFISTLTMASEEIVTPSTGFYIEGDQGLDNSYFDIYTYLNYKAEAIEKINKAGLRNVVFVHQSKKGFTLDKLAGMDVNDSIYSILKYLKKGDLANSYIDYLGKNEIIISEPIVMEEVEIQPSYYNIPVLQNEFEDVLWREYPEFVHKLSDHWVDKTATQVEINGKIVSLLEDVKIEALKSSPITEANFDGIMYRAFKKVIFYGRNSDLRNSLFDAYGPQIDYSDKEKKLHPDLIPLSESIKGSIMEDYFTLLFSTSNAELHNISNLDEVLKDVLKEDFGEINRLHYKILDSGGNEVLIDSHGIFNNDVDAYSTGNIVLITKLDDTILRPSIIVPIKLLPYIYEEIKDLTSNTTDFDPLTRKVKILDENGQVIEDIVEEVLIHNITKGIAAKQEIKSNQRISYIYVSTQNPRGNYEIYFKTSNQDWYRLDLVNYSNDQYLVNEYIK